MLRPGFLWRIWLPVASPALADEEDDVFGGELVCPVCPFAARFLARDLVLSDADVAAPELVFPTELVFPPAAVGTPVIQVQISSTIMTQVHIPSTWIKVQIQALSSSTLTQVLNSGKLRYLTQVLNSSGT